MIIERMLARVENLKLVYSKRGDPVVIPLIQIIGKLNKSPQVAPRLNGPNNT